MVLFDPDMIKIGGFEISDMRRKNEIVINIKQTN
jgi:hypothetical protein